MVRRGVPWPPHRQRRGLRHGLAVRRPSDDAAAELCPGDQSRQRLFDHRPGQRSRPLSRWAGDGRLLAGRRRPRHEGHGHGPGEGRLCRTGADRGVGRFAVACEPSHRRIASQHDRLSDRADHGGGSRDADAVDLVVLFRRRREVGVAAGARPTPAPIEVARRPAPAPEPAPEPVRVAAVAPAPVAEPSQDAAPAAQAPEADAPLPPLRIPGGAVPLPPPRPFDLGSNRSALVFAALAPSSSTHVVAPPRRPELHASAERAHAYSGPARLPPKRPTIAVEHAESRKVRSGGLLAAFCTGICAGLRRASEPLRFGAKTGALCRAKRGFRAEIFAKSPKEAAAEASFPSATRAISKPCVGFSFRPP